MKTRHLILLIAVAGGAPLAGSAWYLRHAANEAEASGWVSQTKAATARSAANLPALDANRTESQTVDSDLEWSRRLASSLQSQLAVETVPGKIALLAEKLRCENERIARLEIDQRRLMDKRSQLEANR